MWQTDRQKDRQMEITRAYTALSIASRGNKMAIVNADTTAVYSGKPEAQTRS